MFGCDDFVYHVPKADSLVASATLSIAKSLVTLARCVFYSNEILRLPPQNERARGVYRAILQPCCKLNGQDWFGEIVRQFSLKGIQVERCLGVVTHKCGQLHQVLRPKLFQRLIKRRLTHFVVREELSAVIDDGLLVGKHAG